MSEQAIHYHTFSLPQKKYFFLSVVYGVNSAIGRKMLWRELCEIKSSMDIVPWIACGDFNTNYTCQTDQISELLGF